MLLKHLIKKGSSILFFLSIANFSCAQKNDSISVIFNQYQFKQGENIFIETTIDTLHLWIDNLSNGKRQKLRYPMLNGYLKVALKVDSTIADGKYAFNFLLSKQFFAVNGKVEKGIPDGKHINYVVSAKMKAPVVNEVTMNPDNTFAVQNFYFVDTVLFSFSPVIKSKENNLQVTINTPLDSAFVPIATTNEFITIGKTNEEEAYNISSNNYSFIQYKKDKRILQEVIVTGRKKNETEKFDEENSRGVFTMGDAKVIDFLSSNDHLSFPDLYSYLQTIIPGIQVVTNANNGQPLLRWRNETTDIYVNEVYEDDFNPNNISLQDIAIIKVYRQGYRLQGGSLGDGLGGTIAIYTKGKNNYNSNKLSNYTFSIKGYTDLFTNWKSN
jgi:hypothetical protein